MNDKLADVRDHYRATGLTERLKAALAVFGPEDERLTQHQLAGLGQADTARRADEERSSDARLERADRLADRRRRHPEPIRGAAEAAVLGNAQERLDAVERARSHCEVLLHGSSTLSRIVPRWKRAYVGRQRSPGGYDD